MSERDLRNEIESLFDQVKRERARLEAPIHDEVEAATAALCSEIDALEERIPGLRHQIASLTREVEGHEATLSATESALSKARGRIAHLDPIPEPENGGCGSSLLLLLGVGLSAATWWLS